MHADSARFSVFSSAKTCVPFNTIGELIELDGLGWCQSELARRETARSTARKGTAILAMRGIGRPKRQRFFHRLDCVTLGSITTAADQRRTTDRWRRRIAATMPTTESADPAAAPIRTHRRRRKGIWLHRALSSTRSTAAEIRLPFSCCRKDSDGATGARISFSRWESRSNDVTSA